MASQPAHSVTTTVHRRRWLSFSLRALLLATAAIAVWLAVQVNRAANQRRAVAAVRERGGRLHYLHECYSPRVQLQSLDSSSTYDPQATPPGPTWLREFLGNEYFQDVIYINLEGHVASEGDDDARIIAKLPKLEYLDMSYCNLSDDALRHLGGIDSLRVLRVDRNQLTDDGLRYLTRCKSLESLDLNQTEGIYGSGLQHLAGLTRLKELDLQYTPLDGDWLKVLTELDLEKLMLSKSPVNDSHMVHVGEMRHLVVLAIDRTNITEDGLAHLTKLTALQQLYLNETAALEGLQHLQRLPVLNLVRVESAAANDAGLKRIRAALPKCNVDRL